MDQSEACPLSVEPMLAADNIGTDGFHIKAEPGQTLKLQAVLNNLTGHTIDLTFTALNAYSGPDGIFYESPDQVDSGTFALADSRGALAQYVSMADKVMLIASMSAVLTVTVTVPDMDEGALLGGFRVTVDGQQIDTPIRIDLPGNAQPLVIAGGLTITGESVMIPIINQSAAIAENVSAAYSLRNKSGSAVMEGDLRLPEMAPLTEYHIQQPVENPVWTDGPYTLSVRINTDGQTGSFTRMFTVGEGNRIEFVTRHAATPAETAVQPETVETQSTAASIQPETEPVAAATNGPAHAEAFTVSGSAISRSTVSGVVLGIPAVFAGVILWLAVNNRRKGKHERPGWREAKGRHAAVRGRDLRPSACDAVQ
jgi:hypothetical protein